LSLNTNCFEVITCGQIGVNKIAPTVGCTGTPPAEREYAVDPVVVEIKRPSD
jgi:hypothetical protein